MKKFILLKLSLLVLVVIGCSDSNNAGEETPTIPPVIVNDVTWADIAFPEGLSTIADPDTGLSIPTGTPTVADVVIYDNSSAKPKVTIIVRDSKTSLIASNNNNGPVPFLSTLSDNALWDNGSFVSHNAVPEAAIGAFALLPGVKDNNSATWVVEDSSTPKTGYFVSINHIGINSKAYKALPADNKHTYSLVISTEDPFAKGEILSSEELTYAEAIAKLPNTTKPAVSAFITAEQKVTFVTFKNPKKGYEIRVPNVVYADFKTDLRARFQTGAEFEGKSHPKGTPMGTDGWGFDFAFGQAVPPTASDKDTAAWAFVDSDYFVSFIYHGPKSPNNPLPASGKNLFIIEVMQDDPMWFMPLADDNVQ